MRITGLLLALTCFIYPIRVVAQEARDADLAALIKTYQAELQEYRNSDDRDPAQSPWKLYPAKFMDFARAKGDDASLRACEFIILNFYIDPSRYDAMELAFRQHRNRRLFPQFVGNLVYKHDLDTKVDSHLAKLAESEDSTDKSIAFYHQARLILDRRDWLSDDPARYDDILPASVITDLQTSETKGRARTLLHRVIELNPEIKYLEDSEKTLVAWAKEDIFAMDQLQNGDLLPDISGTDSQGRKFSISDYRGQIVVITFWAGWCGGCMKDLPEEMEFVSKMKGRPLVWLGVNGDEKLSRLQELEAEHKINFRSWHDGENGSIASMFAVRGWPAMWVIDHAGVIRYRSGSSVDMDIAKSKIEELVAQLERQNQAVNGSRR